MKQAYLVSAKRTAIGSFQGYYASTPAPRLGAVAIRAALNAAHVEGSSIDECIMGEVLTAGVGQAPARQAAIFGGLPDSVPCTTVNKVCGSGLKAVMLATDNIALGNTNMAVAGGQENMTLAPHLMENSRAGYRMGSGTFTDSMVKDGLWDPYSQFHMGSAAELCARECKISRQEQDKFAIESYRRAIEAAERGWFRDEIAPVDMQTKTGTQRYEVDEEPGRARLERVSELRSAFEKDGTVTAANSSKINDGAAAVLVASETAVKEKGLVPLGRVIAHSTFAQDPKWFTTAPVGAIRLVLEKAGLKLDQIDLFEINEAFAVVAIACMQQLGIPHEKLNVHGGAVALGHPIGASGCRVLTTLLHALKLRERRYGLATLCLGGGEAVAMLVEHA